MLPVATLLLPLAATVTLAPGSTTQRWIAPGAAHRFAIPVPAGRTILLTADQRDLDLRFEVVLPAAPAPVLIDAFEHGPESITLLSDTRGVAILTVRAYARSSGSYRFEISAPLPRDPKHATRAAAELRSTQARAQHDPETARAAAQLWSTLDYPHAAARSRLLEADLNTRSRRFPEARVIYESLLAETAGASDPDRLRLRADCLNNIGITYWRQSDTVRALQYLGEARSIFGRLHGTTARAATLNNIGLIHWQSGFYQDSLDLYNEALLLARRGGDSRFEATILNNIGLASATLGDYRRARTYFDQAISLYLSLRDEESAGRALAASARVDLLARDPTAAADRVRRSLALLPRGRNARAWAEAVNIEGEVHAARGRTRDAIRAHEQALEEFRNHEDKRGEAGALFNLAVLEPPAAAIPRLQALSVLFRETGARGSQAAASYRLGLARRRLAESERGRALHDLEDAAAIYEELRAGIATEQMRISYAASSSFTALYEALAAARLEAGDAAGALHALERGRARALLDTLDRLRRRDAQEFASVEVPPVARIQGALPDRALLLVYGPDWPEGAFVWAVTRKSLRAHRLLRRASGAQLLAPLRDELDRKPGVIYVSPSSDQQTVPFASIPLPHPHKGLLVDVGPVVFLPSASAFVALSEGTPRRSAPLAERPLIAFADPVYDAADERLTGRPSAPRAIHRSGSTTWSRLPFTRKEARSIEALVPAGRRSILLDFDATKSNFSRTALARHGTIHVAAHGSFDPAAPHLAALVLSTVGRDGKPVDGRVTLADIYRLSLDGGLVVLSSCNSARGRNVPGEGAMGFTRAFLHSGARAVVATLWKVDDEASARFFELFYKALFVQGAVPSAALRTAQQGLRADSRWSSPDFWAAFVIAGVD